MNEVKIYRSAPRTGDDSESAGASHRFMFYEAAKLSVHPALVRDVQWNPFNVRGYDMFATACKDGTVRIYEVRLSPTSTEGKSQNTTAAGSANHTSQRSQPQSSLTSAIAGRPSSSDMSNTAAQAPPRTHSFGFKHSITQVASLDHAHNDAWALSWDPQGQVLLSNGSDGVTKMWRRSVQNGEWLLFADQKVEFGDEGEEEKANE